MVYKLSLGFVENRAAVAIVTWISLELSVYFAEHFFSDFLLVMYQCTRGAFYLVFILSF